jgi:hypothetical protein
VAVGEEGTDAWGPVVSRKQKRKKEKEKERGSAGWAGSAADSLGCPPGSAQ